MPWANSTGDGLGLSPLGFSLGDDFSSHLGNHRISKFSQSLEDRGFPGARTAGEHYSWLHGRSIDLLGAMLAAVSSAATALSSMVLEGFESGFHPLQQLGLFARRAYGHADSPF